MEEEKLEIALKCSFMRWDDVAKHGSNSPRWTDGEELNYIREQIIMEKKEMEQMHYYPEIYFRETPPQKPRRYMIHADEIRKNAMETLTCYEQDENYKYIWRHIHELDERQREQTGVDAALLRVQELKDFIRLDNLVRMKAHANAGKYLAFFKVCRRDMEELINELRELEPVEVLKEKKKRIRQMELFDYIR